MINGRAPEGAYITSWDDFELLPGVERAIASLNQSQRKVVVVANQRAIALRLMTEPELSAIHENLQTHLSSYLARVSM